MPRKSKVPPEREFESFSAFQEWLSEEWFTKHSSAKKLNPRITGSDSNPYGSFKLLEVPFLSKIKIYLNGDTGIEVLKTHLDYKVTDFIIIPSSKGTRWRFHFVKDHELKDLQKSKRNYGYVGDH
jgi:hypothetical protein